MNDDTIVGVSGLVTDKATSYRMKQVGQVDTEPELKVRSILRESGHHYRLQNSDLPGNPDIANRSRRWAIFVHGCFWHGHSGCRRGSTPKRNRTYWKEKIERNKERDSISERKLRNMGFDVVTVWECEVSSAAYLNGSIADKLRQLGA